jgi:SAM-dependent methyltransferase
VHDRSKLNPLAPIKNRLVDPLTVRICSTRPVRAYLAPQWKDAPYDFVYSHTGAGLSPEDEARRIRRAIKHDKPRRLLFVGVQRGVELLPWLKPGVAREIVAVDIAAFPDDWQRVQQVAVRCGVALTFVVCDAQKLPFATGGTFDLIYSQGLLEHVVDVDAFLAGCAGLLAPGGRVSFYFGPLWHSYGGSTHLGMLGYDHLTVPWDDYLRYARLVGDGWQHWAENGLFCKLPWAEVHQLLLKHFHIERLALLGSRDTRWYKRTYPEKWKRLLARYPESELAFRLASVWARSRSAHAGTR